MTKKNNNIVSLFFACDDKYIPFLAVTLESIRKHASSSNIYDMKVLNVGDISKRNKKRILDEYDNNNFKVEFVNISKHVKKFSRKLHTRDYYSKSTYYRLFIPNLYPNLDKALYLDCDIVVLDDIAKLYNTKLGDNLVGGVPDGAVQAVPEFIEYVVNTIGVSAKDKYFNAGVLLMNLKELRRVDFEKIFIDMIDNVTFTVAQDQDYLNTICKGKVTFIEGIWNKMPIPSEKYNDIKDIKLIHYNLNFKPWQTDGVMYEDVFWKYAEMTAYYPDIVRIRKNYNKALQDKADTQTVNLKARAKAEADDKKRNKEIAQIVEIVCANVHKENTPISKAQDRLEVLDKIAKLERDGIFDVDVEDDPATRMLQPNEVDYLNKKLSSKIKTKIAYKLARKFLNKIIDDRMLVIKDIKGIENWQSLKTGAVITCNHFNAFDSFAMQVCYEASGQNKKHKMFKVIREGNYTNFPGLFGYLMRHCYTLPLSSNRQTMIKFIKAVNTVLSRGDYVLVYPEQSMWWNYRKPRPLKDGAFKFAISNDVPVLPIFITMEDGDRMGPDGFPIQEYTIHVCKPIYPNVNKDRAQNIANMRDANYEAWKQVYEKTYGIPLTYATVDSNVDAKNVG